MRTFLAIEIPEDLHGPIEEVLERLRGAVSDLKWVAPQAVHLTLKFLGEIEETQVEEISRMAAQVADGIVPFDINIKGLGVFPNPRRPRVIFLEMVEGEAGVSSLHRELEVGLEKVGFEREARRFHPHFTLGRVRRGGDIRDLPRSLAPFADFQLGNFPVNMVTLFRSELRPQGARYTRIAQFPLGGREDG